MDRVCPLLGLQADRRTAIDGVDSGHRCHAEEPFLPLDRQQQARVCLSREHERCDRYLAYLTRNGGRVPARSGMVSGLISTRMILAPDPAWRGIAGRARRAPAGSLLAIGAAGVALGIGGAAVATGFAGDVLREAGAQVSSTSPTVPASARASATQHPSTTPSPIPAPSGTQAAATTAAPTEAPSEAPSQGASVATTAAPTAPPQPQETYVVQQGDTLVAIAERFGTTASALQAANGIDDPDEIVIGRTLVIP